MKALDLIASSLNRQDDEPNQALAIEIIQSKRNDWVKELVENLHHSNKNIQSDCIKVLYEIGEREAAGMIAPYYKEFGALLNSRNNRLVWGAMIAIDMIASVEPAGIFVILPQIMDSIDKGSVITIDHGVGILARLSAIEEYSNTAYPLLMEQLKKCPFKQLPAYVEKSVIAINPGNQQQFLNFLTSRIPEMDKESQRVRIKKVIKKLVTN